MSYTSGARRSKSQGKAKYAMIDTIHPPPPPARITASSVSYNQNRRSRNATTKIIVIIARRARARQTSDHQQNYPPFNQAGHLPVKVAHERSRIPPLRAFNGQRSTRSTPTCTTSPHDDTRNTGMARLRLFIRPHTISFMPTYQHDQTVVGQYRQLAVWPCHTNTTCTLDLTTPRARAAKGDSKRYMA